MPENASQSLLNRLYRTVIVLAIALVLGLFLYWLAPDLTPYVGENGAALWSWFLIIASGIAAHFLLPKEDMSLVTDVLSALLVGAVAVMAVAWVSAIAVDLPLEEASLAQLLVVGLAAIAYGCLLFIPIHLIQRRLGRTSALVYPFMGALIAAGLSLIWRPLGSDSVAQTVVLVMLGILGACSAVGFSLVTLRSRNRQVNET